MRGVVRGTAALGAVLAAVVLAPAASASPSSDTESVLRDFSDRDIVSCRFTLKQLQNALSRLSTDADAYAEALALRAEIEKEINRWNGGGCNGIKRALKIVAIKPQGNAAKESVTIKNVGRKTLNLRRYVLRDAADHKISFNNLRLRKGRTVRVITGCRGAKSKPVRRGSRYWACRNVEFWDDAGDIIELVTPQGGLLSDRSYGTPPA